VNVKGEEMKKLVRRITWLAVASLVVTAATAEAQNPIVTDTYAAKFICGVQKDPSIALVPDAQAGHYSTKINVHNNTGITISFRKKIIQLKGGQVPTAPQFRVDESLGQDWALEVVCRDIYKHLNIAVPPDPNVPYPPYIEGFVIFEVFYQALPASPPVDPLDVEGIYTYRAEPAGTDAVSIDVVPFPVKRNRHPLVPIIAGDPQPAAANRPLRQSRP
jgi:hypothetical protein